MSAEAIEAEVLRRLAVITAGYTARIDDLQKLLEEISYGRAVAEWALAGVLSRNLHLKLSVDTTQAQERDRLIAHLARNAGQEFLHAAKLEFTQHAEHAELQHRHYQDYSAHISNDPNRRPQDQYWPRPY
jgi:hypothetical protein